MRQARTAVRDGKDDAARPEHAGKHVRGGESFPRGSVTDSAGAYAPSVRPASRLPRGCGGGMSPLAYCHRPEERPYGTAGGVADVKRIRVVGVHEKRRGFHLRRPGGPVCTGVGKHVAGNCRQQGVGGIEPAGGYLYGNLTVIGEVDPAEPDFGLFCGGICMVSEQDDCRTQVDCVITAVCSAADLLEAVLRNEFL